tara:strand:- start:321 stop:596 length:276 start_codon:yes stop_codon:yes gene_type:complete
MRFNFRINDVELRSTGKHLLNNDSHSTAEIVKWSKKQDGEDYCWVVAYWIKDREGFDLQFVGSRPFDIKAKTFMKVAKQGQQMLDDAFNYL